MSTLNEKLDKLYENLNKLIDKNMPKGDDAKRINLWLVACLTTFIFGMYTYTIDWNPVIRACAHLTGAYAYPAAGAFVSSLAMSGIEKTVNLGIHLYNKKHPEKKKEDFKINPKVKNVIKFISTTTVGIAYTYGTLGYEMDSYANSGIFQAEQYLADIGGSLAGIFAFNKLEPKETLASFMHKVTTLSEAIVKPINTLEEKIKPKSKDNTVERNSDIIKQSLSKEDIYEKTYNSLDNSFRKHITWWKSPNNKELPQTLTIKETTLHYYKSNTKTSTKSNQKTHDNNSIEI